MKNCSIEANKNKQYDEQTYCRRIQRCALVLAGRTGGREPRLLRVLLHPSRQSARQSLPVDRMELPHLGRAPTPYAEPELLPLLPFPKCLCGRSSEAFFFCFFFSFTGTVDFYMLSHISTSFFNQRTATSRATFGYDFG